MKKIRSGTPFITAGSITFLAIYLITASTLFASAFSLLVLAFTYVIIKNRSGKIELEIASSWPEVIDHLISGIQSGMSLT